MRGHIERVLRMCDVQAGSGVSAEPVCQWEGFTRTPAQTYCANCDACCLEETPHQREQMVQPEEYPSHRCMESTVDRYMVQFVPPKISAGQMFQQRIGYVG